MNLYLMDDDQTIRVTSDLLEWATAYEARVRSIGLTTYKDITISTVFLAMDLSLGLTGKPLLFETKVWAENYGRDVETRRCSTLEEAKAQHADAIQRLLNPRAKVGICYRIYITKPLHNVWVKILNLLF